MKKCRNRLSSSLKRYLLASGGNVTMITALATLPMMLITGAAFDYVSMSRDKLAFQAAADAAVLAVTASDKAAIGGLTGSALSARMSELKAMANNFISQNYKSRTGSRATFDINLTVDGKKVRLTATHQLDTVILGGFGVVSPTATTISEVEKAARPVELVLVMDTTGSMGTTYMNQAKAAAKSLLSKVYGGTLAAEPESEFIRVGLVPFSGAVRLDTAGFDFNMSWIDTNGSATVSKLNFSNSSWHNYTAWTNLVNRPWNGCVESRLGDLATDDTAPTTGNSLFTPYFAPDEPSYTNSTSNGYYNSYISSSSEATGINTSNCPGWSSSSTSSSNLACRQRNANKYVNRSISSESSSDYGPWFNCAKSEVVSLTYDRAKVEAGIDAMTSSGSTVIPEGLAWGWRVISPTAPFTQVQGSASNPADSIAPYDSPRWQKIMVLMTDGENDVLSSGNQVNSLNGTWYSAYGRGKAESSNRFGTTTSSQTSAALDAKLTTICENIKDQGITLYTVAFRVSSSTIQNRLRNCATSTTHYSYAADGVALAAIFDHIGENVANTTIALNK